MTLGHRYLHWRERYKDNTEGPFIAVMLSFGIHPLIVGDRPTFDPVSLVTLVLIVIALIAVIYPLLPPKGCCAPRARGGSRSPSSSRSTSPLPTSPVKFTLGLR